MEISVFDVTGPVMIGPSSSHTAGAARLARIARLIADGPFTHVSFGLHGSFAHTYKGHGTDRALVAGALGLYEDDERLASSFALAEEAGLTYDFHEVVLDGMHENSVQMIFSMEDGGECEVTGSSIGGGQIVICRINGFETEFTATSCTLVISQYDRRGIVSEVSHVLSENGINIAVMKLSRQAKGEMAFCIIETDSIIPEMVAASIRKIHDVVRVQAINIVDREG